MRIGIVAPPFIAVPPARYGGTELFIANLASGLHAHGHDVIVYANGDSHVDGTLKWRYRHSQWPVTNAAAAQLKNADHTAWAIHDAARQVDVLHLNDIVGVPLTRFLDVPTVVTLHHPYEPVLSEIYMKYPELTYAAISQWQARREAMPRIRVIYHGIPFGDRVFRERKDDYVAFLGRMAPCKGAHLAVRAARQAGVRLKLAGEIQPIFQDYWDNEVLPGVDGRQVEYVGEADLAIKNDLLGRARALLFPIQWDEPFGLVMIEAMACGTPVLAFAGGSVGEIVRDGVSGWICRDADDMARRILSLDVSAASCRDWAARHFSCDRMVEQYIDLYGDLVAEGRTAPEMLEASRWRM